MEADRRALFFLALGQAGEIVGEGDPERALEPGESCEIQGSAQARIDGWHAQLAFSGRVTMHPKRRRRQAIPVDPVHVAAFLLAKIPPAKRAKLLANLPDEFVPTDDQLPDARAVVNIFRRRERVDVPPAVALELLPNHKPRK